MTSECKKKLQAGQKQWIRKVHLHHDVRVCELAVGGSLVHNWHFNMLSSSSRVSV